MTWPGIEPGPQPWKGCMLTIAPPSRGVFFSWCEAAVLKKGEVNRRATLKKENTLKKGNPFFLQVLWVLHDVGGGVKV